MGHLNDTLLHSKVAGEHCVNVMHGCVYHHSTGFSVTADLGAQVTKISARLVSVTVHEVTTACVH